MKKFLKVYGALPEVIEHIPLDVKDSEMCFVQYLPILVPKQRMQIPDNLSWCKPIVEVVLSDMYGQLTSQDDFYIYLTVKRLYGSGNREGWHCDGFGTDDINYIWYDSHPTEFFDGEMTLPEDHTKSMKFMENNIGDPDDKVLYPCESLLKLTQSSIHRVNNKPVTDIRTFAKISVSDSWYNLKGNAHNYKLNYSWNMKDRHTTRNHPIGE